MAGGGVKPGFIYGATDDIGYFAVEDRMHIHDFHATVLHLMGLDHTRLTYNYSGRDFRLTDVAGVVAQKIIARHIAVPRRHDAVLDAGLGDVVQDENLVRMTVHEFDRGRQMFFEDQNVVSQPELPQAPHARIEIFP